MSFSSWWNELAGKGLPPGVYKFDGKDALEHHRFHLRIDSAQKGALLIDASSIIFLNGSAVDHVRCVLETRDEKQAARYLRRRYRHLDKATALADLNEVRSQLVDHVSGRSVIEIMGTERMDIGKDDLPAPYRMDLAITYRCQNDCAHCYNEHREMRELSVAEWKQVIAKTWKLGIPHIVFTGGEPTLFEGLDQLVAESERYGQVTGLVTNGRMLAKEGYLRDLVVKGLDHVQVTVLSQAAEEHDRLVGAPGAWIETINGVKAAVQEDVYLSTNTTILRSNLNSIEGTMRFLISIGVRNIAFNSIIRSGKGTEVDGVTYAELTAVLKKLQAIAAEAQVRLIWYTPTPYHELNPINLGLGIKQCTACSLNMAVEPDGAVLPCQSYYEPLGNILTDPWDKIWNHDQCLQIRQRRYLDEKCSNCALVNTCGGGCPLARKHGDYQCRDSSSSL
ncbi:MAG: radical SAM protein [Methanomassiliicoccales archaeon]